MGQIWYFVMGAYIPPSDLGTTLTQIHQAWLECMEISADKDLDHLGVSAAKDMETGLLSEDHVLVYALTNRANKS
jgi:hypothetical protein